jgi:hypothetical protein
MRTFEHFPEAQLCPICNSNEAHPVHVSCLELNKFRYNKEHEIIYYNLA